MSSTPIPAASHATGLPFSARSLLFCCHQLPGAALLYSGSSGQSHSQRWAVLAWAPSRTLSARSASQWQQLQRTLETGQTPSTNPTDRSDNSGFISGWMGYFSFDACHQTVAGMQPSATQSTPAQPPLAEFHYYPHSLLLDFNADTVTLRSPQPLTGQYRHELITQLQQALEQQDTHDTALQLQQPDKPDWQARWNAREYEQAFNQVQDYILSGDVYQVNLTMPFRCQNDLTDAAPAGLLEHFDAPFSCYFRSQFLTLFSVSPERFMRIRQRQMTTSPIKGTAPRGKTASEDQANRQWLADSQKNQAENLMIVDLLRNDLGQSARTGSVQVDKLFDIESHANVHHMVSTIQAQLKADISPLQAVLSAFPGGSITGAPKKRALEIIQELEPDSRGLYCGSFGYFSDQGETDFNILIRSVVATTTGAECWAGGGVVKDSTATGEYDELYSKVQALLDIIG
ncbi:anthranilate synthase component I family protein [Oceanobacter sp. 5_MG-2023]|uniref:anthranilate synthase component I family protein n=1 Tax=Oceanobacter sp. 5_MG-2023 TaxID=3062645 RepID=UPI0026E32646|nr:anthranilate synthase component I family protein [Oceanobacter sp. 5_MG-2023]MDO6681022.1 anthranilate synthase component I family protein [Oceanobacter sp. 5_MG-2023]